MKESNKYVNILTKRKIRLLLKEKGIKANNETITELDKYTKKIIQRLLESIIYQLKLEGRKTIKSRDINQAIQTLDKEEYYEI